MKDHLPLDYYGCVEDMLLKVDDDVDMHCHVPTCQRVFHAWDRPGKQEDDCIQRVLEGPNWLDVERGGPSIFDREVLSKSPCNRLDLNGTRRPSIFVF